MTYLLLPNTDMWSMYSQPAKKWAAFPTIYWWLAKSLLLGFHPAYVLFRLVLSPSRECG